MKSANKQNGEGHEENKTTSKVISEQVKKKTNEAKEAHNSVKAKKSKKNTEPLSFENEAVEDTNGFEKDLEEILESMQTQNEISQQALPPNFAEMPPPAPPPPAISKVVLEK